MQCSTRLHAAQWEWSGSRPNDRPKGFISSFMKVKLGDRKWRSIATGSVRCGREALLARGSSALFACTQPNQPNRGLQLIAPPASALTQLAATVAGVHDVTGRPLVLYAVAAAEAERLSTTELAAALLYFMAVPRRDMRADGMRSVTLLAAVDVLPDCDEGLHRLRTLDEALCLLTVSPEATFFSFQKITL